MENTRLKRTPTKFSEKSIVAVSSPTMRFARSPDWKRRKKFEGMARRRPRRAARSVMPQEEESRRNATERTVVSAAVVNPATIMTWVTVASPSRSRIGMMSLKTVSVTIGVISGIRPMTKLTAAIDFQSDDQLCRYRNLNKSPKVSFWAGSPG